MFNWEQKADIHNVNMLTTRKNSISMMIEGVGAGGSVASYLKFIFYVFSIAHVIFFPWKKLDRAVL